MEKFEIIPQKNEEITIPSTICIQYANTDIEEIGALQEITEDNIGRIINAIRNGKCWYAYLSLDPNGEESRMEYEMAIKRDKNNHIEKYWIALMYVDVETDTVYYCYNAQYANSKEEAPISCNNGQSIIEKRYTMHDLELATKCIEYFIRTGKLYPNMVWMKQY